MPNAGQGWANWAYACCVRNIRRGESNHLPVGPVAAAGSSRHPRQHRNSRQSPVTYSCPSAFPPSASSLSASLPFWRCLNLVVLVLLLCFWLTLARLAAFWLAFFKTSGDTLSYTHKHTHKENNSSQSQKKRTF